MSFFVHNAYLHMTNVNTTEDKRITHPSCHHDPGFKLLCVGFKCVYVCVLCLDEKNKESVV